MISADIVMCSVVFAVLLNILGWIKKGIFQRSVMNVAKLVMKESHTTLLTSELFYEAIILHALIITGGVCAILEIINYLTGMQLPKLCIPTVMFMYYLTFTNLPYNFEVAL